MNWLMTPSAMRYVLQPAIGIWKARSYYMMPCFHFLNAEVKCAYWLEKSRLCAVTNSKRIYQRKKNSLISIFSVTWTGWPKNMLRSLRCCCDILTSTSRTTRRYKSVCMGRRAKKRSSCTPNAISSLEKDKLMEYLVVATLQKEVCRTMPNWIIWKRILIALRVLYLGTTPTKRTSYGSTICGMIRVVKNGREISLRIYYRKLRLLKLSSRKFSQNWNPSSSLHHSRPISSTSKCTLVIWPTRVWPHNWNPIFLLISARMNTRWMPWSNVSTSWISTAAFSLRMWWD